MNVSTDFGWPWRIEPDHHKHVKIVMSSGATFGEGYCEWQAQLVMEMMTEKMDKLKN